MRAAARVDHVEEFREGLRREPAAPKLSPDPVPDEPASVVLPAADVAGDRAVGDDRPSQGRVVRERLRPVRHERVAFARRERSHRRRFPVALVLVEDRQIRLDDLAQDAHATSVPPSLRSTIGEAFAGVTLACAGCFDRMRALNSRPRPPSRASDA
jgi:hypothetical protein